MGTEAKIFVSVISISLLLLIGGAFVLSLSSQPATADSQILIRTESSQKTAPHATITVVEFADFQCPACKAFHPLMKNLLNKYPDKINFVYRHFPLPQHNNAIPAAVAAEATHKWGKFWEMYDLMYINQSEWENSTDPKTIFTSYASQLGIPVQEFEQEMNNPEILKKVHNDKADGITLGVNSTPTIFVNGEKKQNKSFNVIIQEVEALAREI